MAKLTCLLFLSRIASAIACSGGQVCSDASTYDSGALLGHLCCNDVLCSSYNYVEYSASCDGCTGTKYSTETSCSSAGKYWTKVTCGAAASTYGDYGVCSYMERDASSIGNTCCGGSGGAPSPSPVIPDTAPGLTVKYYTDSACDGSGLVAEGYGESPLEGEEAPYSSSQCITPGGKSDRNVAFVGGCVTESDTTMMWYDITENFPVGTLKRPGLHYQVWMNDQECKSDSNGWSALYDLSWSVPACRTCEEVFGGPCEEGIKALKFECGDTREGVSDPCFPSSAVVTKADGTKVRMDALTEGDEIIAATSDGTLTTDTVSPLSLAKPGAQDTSFVNLTTAAGATLRLTAEHHLPVGESCCATLKKAKDLSVGDTVWVVRDGTTGPTKLTKTAPTAASGLFSPILTKGSFPVVDGVVTSFDAFSTVTLASYGLSTIESLCKLTGTCDAIRRALHKVA